MIHNMIYRVNHSTGETQVLSLHNRLTNLSHPGIGNEEIKAHLPTPGKRFSEINNLITEDDDKRNIHRNILRSDRKNNLSRGNYS